jgi:hypothetical protein
MKRYIKIQSKGEIDSMAFELIGASTKAGDNTKIGMFGSGLNYSLAYLLRNEIDFHIFSGEVRFGIETELAHFRGKTFNRILINGVETSFTTEMGKDWEAWYILREIYSNALDEEEASIEEVEEVTPKPGYTTFFIEITPEFQEAMDNWELYFSDKRSDLLFESKSGVKVYAGGEDMIVYRKGIRVLHEKDRKCAFHYDFPSIEINESRVVKSSFELEWAVMKFWCRCDDPAIIKDFMKRLKNTYEETLDWKDYGFSMSKAWKEALSNRFIVEKELAGHYEEMIAHNKPIMLPKQMVDSLVGKLGAEIHVAGKDGEKGIKKLTMGEKEEYMLKKAEDFCRECGYDVSYPIHLVQFSKRGILGMANIEDKEIYLAKEAFESLRLLLMTIIEENEHINTGFEDATRAFQDHFIGLFLDEKLERFTYTV